MVTKRNLSSSFCRGFEAGWHAGIRHANKRSVLGHNPEHLSDEQMRIQLAAWDNCDCDLGETCAGCR